MNDEKRSGDKPIPDQADNYLNESSTIRFAQN